MQDDTTLALLISQGFSKTILKRFWSKVKKADECWGWNACIDKYGYGQMTKGSPGPGNKTTAHRISWMIHYGQIPENLGVLHSCDNRSCTRPDHLFLGTSAQNSKDMVNKGRQASGEACALSKLKQSQVEEIIRLAVIKNGRTLNRSFLMNKFGISQSTVHCITHNITWKHIPRKW
jgi:hypothetical protein